MNYLNTFARKVLSTLVGVTIAAVSFGQNAPADDLLVGYWGGVDAQSTAQAHFAGNVGGVQPELNAVRLRFANSLQRAAAIQRLLADPKVRYVEPNYTLGVFSSPNDTYYNEKQYAPHITQTDRAWEFWMPKKQVVVAIVDTGIQLTHPDLMSQLYVKDGKVVGYDFVYNDADPKDDYGHGTHCAGIVDAKGNNGLGVAGVDGWSPALTNNPNNYGVKLMPVKVLDRNGSGTIAQVAAGIVWAANNGANVISLSLGSENASTPLNDAVQYAWGKGCVIVAAAGNAGKETRSYPAACEHVISVASTDTADSLSDFSNYGAWISCAAPGSGIYSTYFHSDYMFMSGTSMATPLVAGEAAMLMCHSPTLTNVNVVSTIVGNIDPIKPANGHLIGLTHGRVNVYKALLSLGGDNQLPTLTAAVFDPATVTGGANGSLNVTLAKKAGPGGVTVGLKSLSSLLKVPASVLVKEGATSARVDVTTSLVGSQTDGTVQASLGTVTLSAKLTLKPITFTLKVPATISGGLTGQGTLTLGVLAPKGGLWVNLSRTGPVTVAGKVLVPEGKSAVMFNIVATRVTVETPYTVNANLADQKLSASGKVIVRK